MSTTKFEGVGKPSDYMAPIRSSRPKKTSDARCTHCGLLKPVSQMAYVNPAFREIGLCKVCRGQLRGSAEVA